MLAKRFVDYLYVINPEIKADRTVLVFAAASLLLNVSIVGTTMLYGCLKNDVVSAIFAVVIGWNLRYFSGGHHAKNLFACYVMTTTVLILSMTLNSTNLMSYAVMFFGGVICISVAPTMISKAENKAKHRLYKLCTLGIILSNSFLLSDILTVLTFFQSWSLLYHKYTLQK
ncbi:accessory gene regulator B family protein [Paenibacillus gansuensis]|uniref:Accessory gene regulator B family protein n=1 Tax=Paenibacillus gansuensis TaxID=306542 RepID=A0ABW5PF16_9BACL